MGSVACATAAGAIALAGAGDTALEVGARLVAVGLVSLVAAIVLGWSQLLPVSLALLGAAYATQLGLAGPTLDLGAPLLAAALLLAAELGYWSVEERVHVRSDPGDGLHRLGYVALLTLTGLVAGAVLLAVADLARTRGLAVDLLGAAAAAAALLVVALHARRQAG